MEQFQHALLGSRSFGSNLPSSIMIPMADNFNHGNRECGWGMINKDLHLKADPDSDYFIPARFLKNNSAIFNNCKESQQKINEMTEMDKKKTL